MRPETESGLSFLFCIPRDPKPELNQTQRKQGEIMRKLFVISILLVSAVFLFGAKKEVKEPEYIKKFQTVVINKNVVLSFKEDSTKDGYKWVYVPNKNKAVTKQYRVVKNNSGDRFQNSEDTFEFIFREKGTFTLDFHYVNISNRNDVKYVINQKIDVRDDVQIAWIMDFGEAKKKAEKEKKPILLLFTGSDWCGPCQSLERDVISTKDFQKYADQNLILCKTEYLKFSEQDRNMKNQHSKLCSQYSIDAYPTTVVVDSAGEEIGRIKGNQSNWLDSLKKFVKK